MSAAGPPAHFSLLGGDDEHFPLVMRKPRTRAKKLVQ